MCLRACERVRVWAVCAPKGVLIRFCSVLQAQRAATAAKLAELELEATDAPIDVRSVQG